MIISPDMFVELQKDKKYKELLPVRDELISDIRDFENKTYDPDIDNICPAPEVLYQVHLQYLGRLCELISEKYNREYVWGEEEETLESYCLCPPSTIGRISDFMWCYNPFRQITLYKDVGINGAV